MAKELSMQEKGALALKKKLGSPEAIKEYYRKIQAKGVKVRRKNARKIKSEATRVRAVQ